MFKMLGHDNREYGPVSGEVLRQWIAERRADARTMVQPAGAASFQPLGELPEFQAALAAAGTRAPAPPAASSAMGSGLPPLEPSTTLARTSLVLGVLSFCLLFFASIPAIITGHIALGRIRREPARYGGKGMATAGLVIGYVGLVLFPAVIAGLTLPALSKAKANAQRITCVNNLKQIALGARIYANDNKEMFPTNFAAMSAELSTPRILVCPADPRPVRAMDWSTFSEESNLSYEFLRPGAREQDVQNQVVFRCRVHDNVALGDGSVQMQRGGRR